MDGAKYLAAIDALCARDLAAADGASDAYLSGPGYRIESLEVSHGMRDGDAAPRMAIVGDFYALKGRIAQELDDRWGRQQLPWGMGTLRLRFERGEEIPEPWITTSIMTDDLDLWQPPGSERWIALGVGYRDHTDEVHVLAVASDIDPV
ncbi:hypothetical protein M2158_001097 [Streptomyces sp. SAI-144]|uniref:hypothetical protein n=1 Tax=unclassified Streptomyces TaxID=2593676 RepID=UPI0024743DC0|nr:MULTISPECIES: hypothetical protein [unclassified Streptomyces]MDH6432620.1 hypothetical protein [Streptomyces sp. SAI-144]MDH6492011.1 hypothetical protein [Streptomyces sp. SAI-127]